MNPERPLEQPEPKVLCDWCDNPVNNNHYYVGDGGIYCCIKCVLDDTGIYEVKE